MIVVQPQSTGIQRFVEERAEESLIRLGQMEIDRETVHPPAAGSHGSLPGGKDGMGQRWQPN